MMPDMDGIETVHEIRKLGGKFNDLIIVALTANAVKSARDMLLENGFDDFVAKPIDTNELREIVRKYLPPEKVGTEAKPDGQKARLDKEEELRRKSIVTFVKENKDTYKAITEALDSEDFKTAHRIAHTLKSSAGYLGKKELQNAAFSLEQSLQSDPLQTQAPLYTHVQLEVLEKELTEALNEFEPLVKEAASEKPDATEIDVDELSALLSELRPLLESSDFGATGFVERLQGIVGMEELAERIDDYDFESAFKLLNEISPPQ
jgi:HPt (histidine-containing phosphotransfer) domain-containing protein